MANSNVQICNFALSYIGETVAIAALDNTTKASRLCSLHYTDARQSLLEAHDWPFARRYAALALSSDVIPTDYTYVYQAPADALMIRRVGTFKSVKADDIDSISDEYDISLSDDGASKSILTDTKEAFSRYTVDLEQVTVFPRLFVNALAWEIASRISMGLTSDVNIYTNAKAEAFEKLNIAMTNSSNEEFRVELPVANESSGILEAREGYG